MACEAGPKGPTGRSLQWTDPHGISNSYPNKMGIETGTEGVSLKLRIVTIAVLVIVAVLMVAAVAQAASSTTAAIIKDAQDGHLDGNYTAAQVQTALAYVKSDPSLEQYTNVEGVLSDFLASEAAPASQNGSLLFTGGSTVVIFGVGLALMGSGLLLRRRLTA